MSVRCRYCKHWANGRCLDEEVRRRRWSDGSLFDPPKRGAEDGCSWRFEEKEREENGNG